MAPSARCADQAQKFNLLVLILSFKLNIIGVSIVFPFSGRYGYDGTGQFIALAYEFKIHKMAVLPPDSLRGQDTRKHSNKRVPFDVLVITATAMFSEGINSSNELMPIAPPSCHTILYP
jgi:hypothetical protein